jgi:hypothetical protein
MMMMMMMMMMMKYCTFLSQRTLVHFKRLDYIQVCTVYSSKYLHLGNSFSPRALLIVSSFYYRMSPREGAHVVFIWNAASRQRPQPHCLA